MEDGNPEYPRSSGKWWFGCDESSKLLKADRPHEDDQDADLIDAGKSLQFCKLVPVQFSA